MFSSDWLVGQDKSYRQGVSEGIMAGVEVARILRNGEAVQIDEAPYMLRTIHVYPGGNFDFEVADCLQRHPVWPDEDGWQTRRYIHYLGIREVLGESPIRCAHAYLDEGDVCAICGATI